MVNQNIRQKIQGFLIYSFLSLNLDTEDPKKSASLFEDEPDEKLQISKELDESIEKFYTKIIDKFITVWYEKI